MRLRHWMMVTFATVLLGGCASTRPPEGSYCDLVSPFYFSSQSVVDSIDNELLRDIITHNEKWESLCAD